MCSYHNRPTLPLAGLQCTHYTLHGTRLNNPAGSTCTCVLYRRSNLHVYVFLLNIIIFVILWDFCIRILVIFKGNFTLLLLAVQVWTILIQYSLS